MKQILTATPRHLLLLTVMVLFCLPNAMLGQKYVNREWVEMSGIPDTVQFAATTFDNDGNLLVAGNTFVGAQNTDVLLTKYNRSGELLCQQTYGGTYRDYGVAVGNIIDVTVVTYCWQINSPGIVAGPPKYIPSTPSELITPYSLHLRNNDLVNIPKLQPKLSGLQVSPNPATNALNILLPDGEYGGILSIECSTGQNVGRFPMSNHAQETQIDISALLAGLYIAKYVIGTGVYVSKFIKS